MDPSSRSKPDLLIVDDDPLISDTLNFVLSRDFNVYVAESREQMKSLLRQLDAAPKLALVKVADGFIDPVGVTERLVAGRVGDFARAQETLTTFARLPDAPPAEAATALRAAGLMAELSSILEEKR